VLSKIGQCGSHHVVDINDHTIPEVTLVNAFKPKGEMVSIIIHAQCSIWNMQHHDRVYLKQECVDDLIVGISSINLSRQLDIYRQPNTLKHVTQVGWFFPVLLF